MLSLFGKEMDLTNDSTHPRKGTVQRLGICKPGIESPGLQSSTSGMLSSRHIVAGSKVSRLDLLGRYIKNILSHK